MSFLDLFKHSQTDVEIWDCQPLVIADADNVIYFADNAKIEFTPPSKGSQNAGSVIFDTDLVEPKVRSLSVELIEYYDSPQMMFRRQGMVLKGSNPDGFTMIWYIGGAADRFMTDPTEGDLPYDEETAKLLEEEADEVTGGSIHLVI